MCLDESVTKNVLDSKSVPPTLAEAVVGTSYTIKAIDTDDEEMQHFLLTLGCFEGEIISVVSIISETYVIVVKGARYSIDRELASAVLL